MDLCLRHRLARFPYLRRSVLCTLALCIIFAAATGAQTLRVAAAADLQFAFPELATQFERQSGIKISVSYGSSGNIYAQLRNGAPFDLYFSADISYPEKLATDGVIEPGSLLHYARGRIVLWVPADSPVDPAKTGWDSLLDARVQKIAIANPEHAPYGRAAVEAMKQGKVYDRVKGKLVFGENISQTAQFVQSGSAQAGIVALSLAISPAMKNGKRWEIPDSLYQPLDQAAVILKSSTNKPAAQAFLTFLQSDAGRSILGRYGYTLAGTSGGAAWQP